MKFIKSAGRHFLAWCYTLLWGLLYVAFGVVGSSLLLDLISLVHPFLAGSWFMQGVLALFLWSGFLVLWVGGLLSGRNKCMKLWTNPSERGIVQ